MQMVVVGGQQVPVPKVQAANMVEHIPDDVLSKWLKEAGYSNKDDRDQTLIALNESGFDMPAAWTKVPDSRLVEAGVGPDT